MQLMLLKVLWSVSSDWTLKRFSCYVMLLTKKLMTKIKFRSQTFYVQYGFLNASFNYLVCSFNPFL